MATHDLDPAHHAPVHESAHPTAGKYILIAVILTVVTAFEVAVFYVIPENARALMMIVLAVLAIAKFVLVVAYYMHLKFDAKLLTWLFVAGLAVAFATISGVWAMFNGWGG
jgi:cytochrome c oxidase subunit IV